jgi:transcriptional regulator with XRE-family HTH domain
MVSGRIRDARNLAGYSQQALAKRLQTPQAIISNYESGKSLPLLERLVQIADACHVHPAWLLTGAGDMNTTGRVATDISADGIKNRIVMARVAAGLPYAEIARRSDISLESLRRWELAVNVPRLDMLVKYAEAVGCDAAWLILGVGPSPLKEVAS